MLNTRVYFSGPYENHPGYSIVREDPLGGDPICLATVRRVRRPAELHALCAAANRAPDLLEALSELVSIIDAAGLLNLSNGVQLGPTSWYVKAYDRMELARAAIAKAEGQ